MTVARRFGTAARTLAALGITATVVAPVLARPAAAQDVPSVTVAGPAAGGRAALPIDGLALVRCVEDRAMPCMRVRVQVPGAAAVLARASAAAADGGEVALWRARLGPYTLQPVAVGALRAGAPRVVLTLVDVSGSMADNGGMQVARAAVRSFVRDLGAGLGPADSGLVQAGVAGFSSRGVVSGVRAARFTTPDAAAAAVDRLPAPGGNTGLYAAVIAGVERVAQAARAAGEDVRPALVVVTDGRNDVLDPAGRVRPGDDPGLATGAAGREQAVATARRLGVPVFLLGVGADPDMTELTALAGDHGLAVRTAIDAVALRAALAGVDQALTPGREVLFAAPGVERSSLARPGWPVDVVRTAAAVDGAGETGPRLATHWAGRWPAPVLSAPGYDGVAFGDGAVRPPAPGVVALAPAPAWLRAAADEPAGLGRLGAVALFLAAFAGAAWWLPRALWRTTPAGALRPVEPARVPAGVAYGAIGGGPAPGNGYPGAPGVLRTVPLRAAAAPGVAAPAGVYPGASALGPAASGAPATPPGAVRRDAQEAPPRRPADVTASGARRREPAASGGGQTFAVHRPYGTAPGAPPGGP